MAVTHRRLRHSARRRRTPAPWRRLPSVDDRESKTLAVHHALFDHGAYVLENLDLSDAPPGDYELIAFPTKLVDLDAAPVRAVLRR